jgi:hypothetical protein
MKKKNDEKPFKMDLKKKWSKEVLVSIVGDSFFLF